MNTGLRKVSRTSVGRGVAAVFSAFPLLCAGAAPAAAVTPLPPLPLVLHTRVAAVSVPMPNTPASVTIAVAACPAGTALVGGGIQVGRADPADPTTPTNGLRVKGTDPSDATGAPVANFAINPRHWTAEGTFGGQSEDGDQVTSFAMCATAGSVLRLVAVASINGPTAAATTASVTATCPAGTTLVGGGALGTPASSPSFKPVGSFPSDASGTMAPDGARNPRSWTAIGSAGGGADPANVTTAFAVCSISPFVQTTVVRVDAPGPTVGSTFTTVPATCATGTRLLGGGVNADNSTGPLQQGVHLRGSYPSDAAGKPVGNGAVDPTTWTGIVQAGGQPTPHTVTHTFALCGAFGLPNSA